MENENRCEQRWIHPKLCVFVRGVVGGSYATFIDLFMHIPESFIKHFLRSALHADTDCGVQRRCGSSDWQFPKLEGHSIGSNAINLLLDTHII